MRLLIALPLAAAIMLAGCKSEDKPKSEDEVRKEATKLANPVPGLYRSTSKLVSFEVPGMPAAQADRVRQMFSAGDQGREYCLSAEEASKGFGEAMKKLPQGKCSYDRFNVSGNMLDAQLTCQTGQDMTGVVGMKGTVTETGSQMTMSIDQSVGNGAQGHALKIVAEVKSERIGDCPELAK